MRWGAASPGVGCVARPEAAFLRAPGLGERARRGAGAGSEAGRKGQPGPGGLRPRVAAVGPAPSTEAARGEQRSAPGRVAAHCEESDRRRAASTDVRFLAPGSGLGGSQEEPGSPRGRLVWVKPSDTRVARRNPPVRAARPGGVES